MHLISHHSQGVRWQVPGNRTKFFIFFFKKGGKSHYHLRPDRACSQPADGELVLPSTIIYVFHVALPWVRVRLRVDQLSVGCQTNWPNLPEPCLALAAPLVLCGCPMPTTTLTHLFYFYLFFKYLCLVFFL